METLSVPRAARALHYRTLEMRSAVPAPPLLRLATTAQRRIPAPLHRRNTPAQAVRSGVSENRAAPQILATDPRWVLAVRAASQIQGGRAAVLTPDRRCGLLALASRMGLRPFDASLVIAVVQDAARAGDPLLGPETEHRLAIIPVPSAASSPAGPSVVTLLAASVLAGVGVFAGLLAWVGAL